MCKKDCKCCPKILFFNEPETIEWILDNDAGQSLEVVLFEERLKLKSCKTISVDSAIAAEITRGDGAFNGINTHNVYRLYINDVQVAQAGYETDIFNFLAPRLETSSLLWGGRPECSHKHVTVKVTAQLKSTSSNLQVSSDINNTTGNFAGAKGAFLRITLF